MKFYQFLFSDNPRQRVLRHLLFWAIYSLHYWLQAFHARVYEDLFQQRIYTNALLDFCCFMPGSVFVVYSFTSYLFPFIKGKNYVAVFLLLFLIYLLGMVINYFASLILLNNVNVTIPIDNSFYNRIQIAIWNTKWAMCVGIVVIGIELAKSWHLQTRINLAILKSNAKAEMRIEKSRLHPEWLFNALNKINASLVARSATSPTMILNLSDLLSYSLYESDEDLVHLEQELLQLQHLVSLEQGDTTTGFSVTMRTSGNIENSQIAPMSVINKIVQQISAIPKEERRLCSLDLHFSVKQNTLVLDLKMICATDVEMTTIQWPITRLTNSVSNQL